MMWCINLWSLAFRTLRMTVWGHLTLPSMLVLLMTKTFKSTCGIILHFTKISQQALKLSADKCMNTLGHVF